MTDLKKTIGLVGLGRMGSRLLTRFVHAGYEVYAYDVSPEARKLSMQGVQIADTIAGVCESANTVVLSLPNTDVVRSVVCQPDGLIGNLGKGSVIIDTSTIAPSACEEISKLCAENQISFLDCPVSGGITWAESGDLTVMVGGSQAAFERSVPILETFGKNLFYIGQSGLGQIIKLCHQLVFYATSQAIIESAALGETLNIDRKLLLSVLAKCTAPNHVLSAVKANLENENYENVLTEINLALKDLKLINRLSGNEEHAGNRMSLFLEESYQTAVNTGFGHLDQTIMGSLYKNKHN